MRLIEFLDDHPLLAAVLAGLISLPFWTLWFVLSLWWS
jgi:hypothetical protein